MKWTRVRVRQHKLEHFLGVRTGPAVPGIHCGASPLVKCLLLTWVKMVPNKPVHKSAFASRNSANQQDVVGHYVVAGLSKDIYIYYFIL